MRRGTINAMFKAIPALNFAFNSAVNMIGVVLGVALLAPAGARGGQFVTIDCPGSTDTGAAGINTAGEIVGSCTIDGYDMAFLRLPNGVIHVLSIPNAAWSEAADINDSGVVAGAYYDNSSLSMNGFVFGNSAVTSFSVAGASITFATAINASGVIVGQYGNSDLQLHGFVRDAQGNITTFDAVLNALSTRPWGIDSSGEITGDYSDPAGTHGFIRDAQGNTTTFDVPGSDPSFGSYPRAMNASGEVTGWWRDSLGVYHGFTRDPLGNYTRFAVPGDGWTFPVSINDSGEIVGTGTNTASLNFGFALSGSSTLVFQDPLGITGGTAPQKINSRGEVVGFYEDIHGIDHGFYCDSLPPADN